MPDDNNFFVADRKAPTSTAPVPLNKVPEPPVAGEPVAAGPKEPTDPELATFRVHEAKVAGKEMYLTVEADNGSWLMNVDAKKFAYDQRAKYPGFHDAGIEFYGGPTAHTVPGNGGETRLVWRRTFKLTQGV